MQPVFDNDYQPEQLLDAGYPPRWQPWSAPGEPTLWNTSDKYRSFETDGKAPGIAWLRYQHLLPDVAIWHAVENGERASPPRPDLIRDFYAYNDGDFPNNCSYLPPQSEVWVGDLAVDFTLDINNQSGGVVVELVKGGVQFRCYLDIATGQARLAISSLPQFAPQASTPIKGPGTHRISFANVDEQLLLLIDGKEIQFDGPTSYPPLGNFMPVKSLPQPGSDLATDLSPVGIAADGGVEIRLSHLNIRRDVYYLSREDSEYSRDNIRSAIDLDHDEFFMLGDNSPRSSDSRYWRVQNYVDRKLLIGKALFVYWPHSFNYVEVGSKKIPLPFWPNFGRMRFVH